MSALVSRWRSHVYTLLMSFITRCRQFIIDSPSVSLNKSIPERLLKSRAALYRWLPKANVSSQDSRNPWEMNSVHREKGEQKNCQAIIITWEASTHRKECTKVRKQIATKNLTPERWVCSHDAVFFQHRRDNFNATTQKLTTNTTDVTNTWR